MSGCQDAETFRFTYPMETEAGQRRSNYTKSPRNVFVATLMSHSHLDSSNCAQTVGALDGHGSNKALCSEIQPPVSQPRSSLESGSCQEFAVQVVEFGGLQALRRLRGCLP